MSKVDELKVYTGKETIEALLEGKVLKRQDTKGEYRFNDGQLQFYINGKFCKIDTSFTDVYNVKFTEVVTPQVGDWVRVTCKNDVKVAQIEYLEGTKMYAYWSYPESATFFYSDSPNVTWEILSPEQVTEYKRELAFSGVGRKLDEFKPDDIVYVESLGEMAVVVSNVNDQEVRLHKVNKREGLTAKPHQLTPISFVEDQVDLT